MTINADQKQVIDVATSGMNGVFLTVDRYNDLLVAERFYRQSIDAARALIQALMQIRDRADVDAKAVAAAALRVDLMNPDFNINVVYEFAEQLASRSTPASPPRAWHPIKLGVVTFHPQPALRERFYEVVDDLRESGSIVDLWLLDIATVLKEHGYEMTITPLPTPPAQEEEL